MNSCKVCGKDVWKHNWRDVRECLSEQGISPNVNAFELASTLGVAISVNPRHKSISFCNGPVWISENLDLDILRCCLVGEPKEKKGKKKDQKILDPKIESGDFLSITIENNRETLEDSTNVEGE